jgi:hypothetical protein
MNSRLKHFYSLIPNYAALRELEEKYYHQPTEEEIRQFLDFWQDFMMHGDKKTLLLN